MAAGSDHTGLSLIVVEVNGECVSYPLSASTRDHWLMLIAASIQNTPNQIITGEVYEARSDGETSIYRIEEAVKWACRSHQPPEEGDRDD